MAGRPPYLQIAKRLKPKELSKPTSPPDSRANEPGQPPCFRVYWLVGCAGNASWRLTGGVCECRGRAASFRWPQRPAESCFQFLDEDIAANRPSRSKGMAEPFQLSMIAETHFQDFRPLLAGVAICPRGRTQPFGKGNQPGMGSCAGPRVVHGTVGQFRAHRVKFRVQKRLPRVCVVQRRGVETVLE